MKWTQQRGWGPRGRFEPLRQIGEGGFGEVWEAVDRESGARVALKRLKRPGPEELRRLKAEFRALAGVVHPRLVTLHELCVHEGDAYFSMELVAGVDVLSWVRGGEAARVAPSETRGDPSAVRGAPSGVRVRAPYEPLALAGAALGQPEVEPMGAAREPWSLGARLERLRPVFTQLAEGVAALHARGIVHRDLKPSNVLVDAAGGVRILDYGLAAARGTSARGFEGTPAYAAPEQALGEPAAEPSDVYALGVIVFEALADRRPFEGDPQRMLAQKAQRSAPGLAALVPGAPEELCELVARMLEREPGRRPSCSGILDWLSAWGAGSERATVRREAPRASRIVGRDQELEALLASARRAREGRFECVSVEGPSGIGKSALLDASESELAALGFRVLRARCSPRESVPYNGFDAAIDQLARLARDGVLGWPEALERAEIARVFPVFAGAARPPPAGHAGAFTQRARAFAATADWLHREGRRAPLAFLLDDFHWSDAESRALLAALVERRPEGVLLVVSQRATGSEAAALPVAWGALRIELGPLSHGSLRALASALGAGSSGELDAASFEAAAIESRGHPLWFVESLGAAPLRQDASLDDRLRERVRGLEPGRRRLVELLALAAEPLDEPLLARLWHGEGVPLVRELDELASERLVRRVSTPTGPAFDVFHDRVREAVAASLSLAARAALHAELARVFERGAGRDAAVAHHLAGAGELGRASEILLRLADRAASSLAFEHAAELLAAVLERGGLDDEAELEVALRRAELLEWAHRSVDAAEQLVRVAPRLPGREQRRVEAKAAELLLASGELARGKALLGRLLERVGAPLPATPSRTLVAMLVERASLARRGLGLGTPPAVPEARAELDEKVGLLRGAAIGLGMCDNLRASLYHVRAVRAALDLGDPSKASIALSIEAIFRGSTSSSARRASEPLLELAQRLASRSGDDEPLLWVEAARATRGALELRGPEAEAELARVERAFRDSPTGNTWAIDSMLLVRLLSLRLLGSAGALRLQLPELLADAARRADRYLETTLLRGGAWVCLCDDDPAAARRTLERSSWVSSDEGVHVQHWIELDALGEIALYEGAGATAAVELAPKLLGVERSLLSRLQRIRVLTRFLHGRLLVARAGQGKRGAGFGARTLALLLRREEVGYALAMGALLEACVEHLAGRAEPRRRALERGAAIGAAHGLTLLEASALLALAELGHAGQGALDRAHAHFERERIVAPRRLAASLLPGLVTTR